MTGECPSTFARYQALARTFQKLARGVQQAVHREIIQPRCRLTVLPAGMRRMQQLQQHASAVKAAADLRQL